MINKALTKQEIESILTTAKEIDYTDSEAKIRIRRLELTIANLYASEKRLQKKVRRNE